MLSLRVVCVAALAAGVAAQGQVLGECCSQRGAVAAHVFGVIICSIFLISMSVVHRWLFPASWRPASAAFCRRALFQKLFDIFFCVLPIIGSDEEDISDGDRKVFVAFTIANSVVLLFLMLFWSPPIQKFSLFLGGQRENARRAELERRLAKVRTTMTGRRLISETLRQDISAFNLVLHARYKLTKRFTVQVLVFKVVTLAFVIFLYSKFCTVTNCSFATQAANVFSVVALFLAVEDVWILVKGRPVLVEIGSETGKGTFKVEPMTDVEAHKTVRDLVLEILDHAKACVNELAAENGFISMSVMRYDWDSNPDRDPRIDACAWVVGLGMLVGENVEEQEALSIVSLHTLARASGLIVNELYSEDPKREPLIDAIKMMYQTLFFSLPQNDQETFTNAIKKWVGECQNFGKRDPRRHTLGMLWDKFLPSDIQAQGRPEEELLDESLVDYLTGVEHDVKEAPSIVVKDDCLLEWANLKWKDLRAGALKDHPRLTHMDENLSLAIQRQSALMIRDLAPLLFNVSRELKDDEVSDSEAFERFEQGLNKAVQDADNRTSQGGGEFSISTDPFVCIDRIPQDMLRVAAPPDALGDEFLPFSTHKTLGVVEENVDLRKFGPFDSDVIALRLKSPLHQAAGKSSHKRFRGQKRANGGNVEEKRKRLAERNRSSSYNVNSNKFTINCPSMHKIRDWFLDYTMYILASAAWLFLFFRSVETLGDRTNFAMNKRTFLGMPPHYTFQFEVTQAWLIPFVYGVMHGNLVFLGIIPLTMSRWTIRQLSRYPHLSRFLRLEHAYYWHRRCGYNLWWGILIGAVLWWFAMSYSCTEHGRGCDGFYPEGNYIDIYNNLGAVVFLREVISTTLVVMALTAGLIFPSGLGRQTPFVHLDYAYEYFYYSHVIGASAIAVLAFSSRFDVFYPVLVPWGWYALDVAIMFLFNIRLTKVGGAVCFGASGKPALFLKIVKPRGFHYQAGQTAFIKIPCVSKLQWHPFSMASAPDDPFLEFLIDCSHGRVVKTVAGPGGKKKEVRRSWTNKLFRVCQDYRNPTHGKTTATKGLGGLSFGIFVYGPCGSSFQEFEEHDGVMLVGGGSGLPSSLSCLRHVFNMRSRSSAKMGALKRVSFVWSTRYFESVMWCWEHLKQAIEKECGFDRSQGNWDAENDEALSHLSSWLDIQIGVTRMQKESLHNLVNIEKESAVGSWMIRRVTAGRVSNWAKTFRTFFQSVGSDDIKVFFCGPSAMAAALREGAKEIKNFNIEVSSENFHDS